MKHFLLALILLSAGSVFAATCESVWVYQNWKSCPTQIDVKGQPTLWRHATKDESKTRSTKESYLLTHQEILCKEVVDGFNRSSAQTGIVARLTQPTPVDQHEDIDFPHNKWTYWCSVDLYQLPRLNAPSESCGLEDKWNYSAEANRPDVKGQVKCLSCDDVRASGSDEELAQCLVDSVNQVVNAKAVELRDTDLAALSKQVRRVLSMEKYHPLSTLEKAESLSTLTDFIDK